MPGALQPIPGVTLLRLALCFAGVYFSRKLQLVSRMPFPAGTAGSEGCRMCSVCAWPSRRCR